MFIDDDFVRNYKPDPALADPVILEMHAQNDRGAAIMAGVHLAEKLKEAIVEQWPPISTTNRNRLFEGYGALSSFNARIDIAAAMGVLDAHVRSDFHKIRQIRNLAAHAGAPFSFDGQRETTLVDQIECAKVMPPDEDPVSRTRNRFTASVKMLVIYLFFQAQLKKRFGHQTVMPHYSTIGCEGNAAASCSGLTPKS